MGVPEMDKKTIWKLYFPSCPEQLLPTGRCVSEYYSFLSVGLLRFLFGTSECKDGMRCLLSYTLQCSS